MLNIPGYIGKLPEPGQEVHIAGAGISGLMMAWHLKQKGFKVSVFDTRDRAGGLIRSHQKSEGLSEAAANGVIWSEEMHEMCTTLGIKPLACNARANKRYIIRNGIASRFPLTLFETLSVLPRLFQNVNPDGIQDMETFGNTCLSPAVTRYLIEPALYGIYASELKYLGTEALMPGIFQSLREGKNLFKALKKAKIKSKKNIPKGLHSFPLGIESLVIALSNALNSEIYLKCPVPQPSAHTHLISTVPSYQLDQVIEDKTLLKITSEIQYVPLCSCTLFFNRNDIQNLPQGFGCLIPGKEGFMLLGILFNHDIFPNRVKESETLSLTCIYGGYGREDITDLEDSELLNRIQIELFQLFKFNTPFRTGFVHRYKKALPLYSPQLPGIWAKADTFLKAELPNVSLFGNYTGEISIRGLCSVAAKVSREAVKR